MTDKPSLPIVVTGSALQETVLAALRVLGVLAGGWTAIAGFVGKRDLSGLIAYIQSSSGLALCGAIVAVGSFAYGLWKTYYRKQTVVSLAQVVPDAIAVVKGKTDA